MARQSTRRLHHVSRRCLSARTTDYFDRAEAAYDKAKRARFSIYLVATRQVFAAADQLFDVLRETIVSMNAWRQASTAPPGVASQIAALDTARNQFIELARDDLHRFAQARLWPSFRPKGQDDR